MKDLGQLGTYGSTLAFFRNGLSREPETELRGGWSSEEKAVVEDALFRLLGCRFSGELLGHRPLMIHRRVVKTVLMEGFTCLVLLPFCFLRFVSVSVGSLTALRVRGEGCRVSRGSVALTAPVWVCGGFFLLQ